MAYTKLCFGEKIKEKRKNLNLCEKQLGGVVFELCTWVYGNVGVEVNIEGKLTKYPRRCFTRKNK